MVLFDSDFLSVLLHERIDKVLDPKTKKPVERIKDKIRHLIDTLDKAREKILIPTPVLSEILCLCGNNANDVLAELMDTYGFEPAPFDVVAAVEAAIAISDARIREERKPVPRRIGPRLNLTDKSWQSRNLAVFRRFIQMMRT